MSEIHPAPADLPASGDAPVARQRPAPGQRRDQILQALAAMLEQPGSERITTAALARQLMISEAALYRHFASKAQMFEGLIDFIEHSVFTLINQITEREGYNAAGAERIVAMLLQFGERNPGMVRVMAGDALVHENERLQQRMNLFFDKVEAALRQCLRPVALEGAIATPTVWTQVTAAALCDLVRGRLQRYARTGFRRSPTQQLGETLALLLQSPQ